MIARILKSINPTQFFAYTGMVWKRPLFIYPSIKATLECQKISHDIFGNKHNQNAKPNAFKHGLWSVLVAKECSKWSKNTDKVMAWTLFFAAKNEALFENPPLERTMDEHNNVVSRALFLEIGHLPVSEIVLILKSKLDEAVAITPSTNLDQHNTNLVYIAAH